MTVLNFKHANHPQQVAKRGPEEEKDERYTPLSLFNPLHARYRFALDVCGCAAAPVTRVIGHFYDRETNALTKPWTLPAKPGPWWGNVPFSLWALFLEKAWDENAPGMMLLPANRTEQKPWQRLVEPYRDRAGSPLTSRFVASRQQFGTPEHPDGDSCRWNSSPPYGLVLLSWHLHDSPLLPVRGP